MSNIKPIVYLRAGHSGIHPETGEYLTMQIENAKYFKHTNGKKYHRDGYFFEGVSNRNITNEYVKQATAAGLHVVHIHHPYEDYPLGKFCQSANEHYKEFGTMYSPALFLDMHSNASDGRARGFYSFYYPTSTKGKKASDIFAAKLNPYWAENGSRLNKTPSLEGWMYNADRTKKGIYYMLQNTDMPAIIVENGFFDNPYDADLLMNHEFCMELVRLMVQASWEYFNSL